jgi:hypothetical protein
MLHSWTTDVPRNPVQSTEEEEEEKKRSYLMDEQFGYLHMVIEGSQMQCSIAVILLLVHDPRPGQLGQQNPHSTAHRQRTK